MPKFPVACALSLAVALGIYPPQAAAIKVTRDNAAPRTAVPPRQSEQPAPVPANLPKLSVGQIVDRNVSARGGLSAWRAVQSMTITGKLDAGGKKDTLLPYTLQVKRPNKQRLAIEFAGHTALQVFDGAHGWKLRPFLNRADPEPYSPEELKKALSEQGFEGPIIDYAAKGNKVELEGTEMLEGKGTYRLKVTTREGHEQHVWIDGSTFLEAKIESNPRRFDGQMRKVETYLRDYRKVQGLTVPFVQETHVARVAGAHSMTIDKLVLNAKIDDSAFARPPSLTAQEMPAQPRMVKLEGTAGSQTAPAVSKP